MSDMKEAAVQIRVNADGKVTVSIDETLRRSVITACSQAFCGAFDFAGEHENEVVNALKDFAETNAAHPQPELAFNLPTVH